jgi:hypothetical protein
VAGGKGRLRTPPSREVKRTTLRDGELLLRLRAISSWGAETRGGMEGEGRCYVMV